VIYVLGEQEFCVYRKGLARVLTLREELGDTIEAPERVAQAAKNNRLSADILTFTERFPETTRHYGYVMEWDNLAVLAVSNYDYWLKKQAERAVKRKVRKAAQAGIQVSAHRFSRELVNDLAKIFNETPIRRGRRYPYYGMKAEQIAQAWIPDAERSLFLLAECENEPVGFMKLLMTEHFGATSGSVTKLSHRDRAPMNALIAKAVDIVASRGLKRLIFGKFEYSGQIDSGLTMFKKHNGFERVEIPRYYIPLSVKGKVLLCLRLYRPLSTLVPISVARRLGRVRERWLRVRFRSLATPK
jgi:hypothetical protein